VIVSWRIDKFKHLKAAFDGEGARVHGGRWNHKGTPIVYLSGSLALAALEKLVHLSSAAAKMRFVAVRIRLPASIVATLPRRRWPPHWRKEPPPDETKDAGTAWAKAGTTAVLKVPSVIVPCEFNFLVNPLHPDFAKLRRQAPEAFSFDPRLWT
jgi:RES domain-containing protein